jgi:hypothetical protein
VDRSTFLVADHYCVSHVPAATIPGSRLSSILARMHQGSPLTKYALDFLRQQDPPGLFRLACGEISHDAYIAGLAPDFLARHQAAKVAHQAKEVELQVLQVQYPVPKTKSSPVTESETERNLRRKRERAASEAVLRAQSARQKEWKAQRERNSELAAVAYQARAVSPNHTEPTPQDVARYFHVGHLPGVLSSPMSDILEALFRGRPLTDEELRHLKHNAPDDLYRLAFGQLTFDAYRGPARAAEAELAARQAARVARIAREEAERAARIARESDPEYIAMMQQRALYAKYGVSLTATSPRMTNLLQLIDGGNRLPQDELVWISTEGKEHFAEPLREAYHRVEAEFHADRYRSTQDPWSLINASGHYRKGRLAETALKLLESVALDRLKHPKVRSALLTTHGGVMRDLGRRSDAIQMGEKAHSLRPRDYRPCTLLGAVHMEQREFERGHSWYEKARERGAPESGIDSELRSIFQRLDVAGREAMKTFLLAEDPQRYRWLNELPRSGKG